MVSFCSFNGFWCRVSSGARWVHARAPTALVSWTLLLFSQAESVSYFTPPKESCTLRALLGTQTNAKGATMIYFFLSLAYAGDRCLLESCPNSSAKHPEAMSVKEAPLLPCSQEPLTGFYRDSYCRTGAQDRGIHVVCGVMTPAFLRYTREQGNDLTTPSPQYQFPGLKEGDRWCLCAARWQEAYLAGVAPMVVLEATDRKALETVPKKDLEKKAVTF